jgi:hypothetical protein
MKHAKKITPAPFHCVEVKPGDSPCPRIKQVLGKRYLSRESPPQLPISGCDKQGQCSCRYEHYSDRRTDLRRAADSGRVQRKTGAGEDRRLGRVDRRSGGL